MGTKGSCLSPSESSGKQKMCCISSNGVTVFPHPQDATTVDFQVACELHHAGFGFFGFFLKNGIFLFCATLARDRLACFHSPELVSVTHHTAVQG